MRRILYMERVYKARPTVINRASPAAHPCGHKTASSTKKKNKRITVKQKAELDDNSTLPLLFQAVTVLAGRRKTINLKQ